MNFLIKRRLLISVISLKPNERMCYVMSVAHVTPSTQIVVVAYFACPPYAFHLVSVARAAVNTGMIDT